MGGLIVFTTGSLWAQNQLVPVSNARVIKLPKQDPKQEPKKDDLLTVGPKADKQFDSLEGLALATARFVGFRLTYRADVFANDKSPLRFSDEMKLNREEVLELTQTVLRSKGLAIVFTDNPKLRQVVRIEQIRPFAPEDEKNKFRRADYLTQFFKLENVTTTEANSLITKYLNYGANTNAKPPITEIPTKRLLIISETVTNLKKIKTLLDRYDVPAKSIATYFRKIPNVEAEEIVNYLEKILAIKKTAEERAGKIKGYADDVSISTDPRSNRIVLIGPQDGIDQVNDLIDQLLEDTTETKTESYRFQFITADKMDELIRRSLGNLDQSQLEFIYKSVADKQSNQLIVTARVDIHDRIAKLKSQLDIKPDKSHYTSPVQYYKIKHVKADEILRTIQAVERGVNQDRNNMRSRQNGGGPNGNGNIRGTTRVNDGTGNQSGTNRTSNQTSQVARNNVRDNNASLQNSPNDRGGQFNIGQNNQSAAIQYGLDLANSLQKRSVLPGQADVTVDENSNQLIVIAEPAVQLLYRELIEKLDRPRPQVLVEVTVVTIDRNDDQNLGIEISSGDRTGSKRLFAFTQYGLSAVDPTNGALSILPGLGFNGTLIDADVADVVLRSLASHTRTRVVAAPRILVNDNATGILSSVAEVPFAQVNASTTVATTSLGGFAEAGTTISVTPQIGEGENLNLEFDVIISDFTDAAAADLPPPRRSDQVKSSVTIPDGHTVIVGGLRRKRDARSKQGIPFAENIPVFRLLSSNLGVENDFQNIYIFIKPIILRDDKFRDLQFLSTLERRDARLPDDLPKSCPLLIKTPAP